MARQLTIMGYIISHFYFGSSEIKHSGIFSVKPEKKLWQRDKKRGCYFGNLIRIEDEIILLKWCGAAFSPNDNCSI